MKGSYRLDRGGSMVFYPGNYISGTFILTLDKKQKFNHLSLCLKGSSRVLFSSNQTVTGYNVVTRTYGTTTQTKYYSSRVDFKAGEMCLFPNQELEPGSYEVPFNIQIPADWPYSFKACHGEIRYNIHAHADIPWSFDKKYRECFSVVPLFSPALNYMYMSRPLPVAGIVNISSTFDFFSSGSKKIAFEVQLFRNAFCLNEAIDYSVKVTNMSSFDITHFKAKLIRVYHFEAEHHSKDSQDCLSHTEIAVQIKKNDAQIFTTSIPLLSLTPTLDGNINIKVLYKISITAYGGKDGKSNKKGAFCFPVFIAGPKINLPQPVAMEAPPAYTDDKPPAPLKE